VTILLIGVSVNTSFASESLYPGSSKKGFCTLVRDNSDWLQKIQALNAKWFYSWGNKKPADVPEGVDFTPMIWGRFDPEKKAVQLNQLTLAGKEGSIKYLMGFNEPDQPKQSNLSVEEAVKLWPVLEATGLPLCSPGCVHPDRQWMKAFMQEVEKHQLRVDYVCVHSYGGTDAQALVKKLKEVHKLYGRPIWITEFAAGDWQAQSVTENRHTPEKVAQFMRELLPMLEKLDFVHRYAWYSASPDSASLGTSALFNEDGSLTELGKIYSEF